MLVIKEINLDTFKEFGLNRKDLSIYQSSEWYESKGRSYKILGVYDENTLVGASIVTYLKILRFYYFAYASRGFLYDYNRIDEFTKALKNYFSNDKKIVFFRMDPLVVLNTYDKDLNCTSNEDGKRVLDELIKSGFIHFGFNEGYETTQFRFINHLKLESSFEEQLKKMNHSTRKNIQVAENKGVQIRKVGIEEFDLIYDLFEKSASRKGIHNFGKDFYLGLLDKYGYNASMYLAYIEKQDIIKRLKIKINDTQQEIDNINKMLENGNVGDKLKNKKAINVKLLVKYQNELKEATDYNDVINIGSLFAIFYNNEVVALASGMDNNYRSFCPKYAMYPAMIKDAIDDKFLYANFLGVKNIKDKNDSAYGVFEVKRGFGGETVEYIGELDLPLKNGLYKLYKMKENKERK